MTERTRSCTQGQRKCHSFPNSAPYVSTERYGIYRNYTKDKQRIRKPYKRSVRNKFIAFPIPWFYDSVPFISPYFRIKNAYSTKN